MSGTTSQRDAVTGTAAWLLTVHQARPERALFAHHEAARENIADDELRAAYAELEDRGLVRRSGQFVSFGQGSPRPCYRLTDDGERAVPARPAAD